MSARRLYAAVAAGALVFYLGALGNRFAQDDNQIIAFNALVHHISGLWLAFVTPYWPPDIGGGLFRPLPIASYTLDWSLGGGAAWWFHAVNLAWHAAASVAVACLARHWSGDRAALAAGLLFAVHPVHVEAVANVVGRAELMMATFAILSVYAALVRDHLWWSAAALAAGLLSKENAVVVPGLVAWGWIVGLARPSRQRMAAYGATWAAVGVLYFAVRWNAAHEVSVGGAIAPVFFGAPHTAVRLTATAAFADVTRLLVFPLKLRVDYSPAERTLVTTALDLRFALGLLWFAAWATLLWLAWRRGRRVEAFGLGWIAIALFPVSNLAVPVGVLLAERTLYLPSVGLVLAVGAWLKDLSTGRFAAVLGLLVILWGVRTVSRVSVWHDSRSVLESQLEDSPNSFLGPANMVPWLLTGHQPAKALEYFRRSRAIYDVTLPWLDVTGAEAAWATGNAALADSILTRLELVCRPCDFFYRYEAPIARARGYPAAADSFLARIGRIRGP